MNAVFRCSMLFISLTVTAIIPLVEKSLDSSPLCKKAQVTKSSMLNCYRRQSSVESRAECETSLTKYVHTRIFKSSYSIFYIRALHCGRFKNLVYLICFLAPFCSLVFTSSAFLELPPPPRARMWGQLQLLSAGIIVY